MATRAFSLPAKIPHSRVVENEKTRGVKIVPDGDEGVEDFLNAWQGCMGEELVFDYYASFLHIRYKDNDWKGYGKTKKWRNSVLSTPPRGDGFISNGKGECFRT